MEKFSSGNIVRLPDGPTGSLVIITGYRNIESKTFPNNPKMNYKVCDYIYTNFAAMIGCTRVDTFTETVHCDCRFGYGNKPDPDCEDCKGTGKYESTTFGMDEAVLVAPTVKDWIESTLLKGFKF